jgi:Xaa-Pro aminopeptidase
MAFTEVEYRQRVKVVRGFMAENNLDAMLVTEVPNICYLSGYETFVPDNFVCLVLPIDGEPTLQVAEFEIPGALLNSWVKDVRATKFNDPAAIAKELCGVLQAKRLERKRIGIESKLLGLNVALYQSLTSALDRATFVDASALVYRARLVKSETELAYMRLAADIARKAVVATANSVRPGLTENDIASVAYGTVVKGGGEYFSSQPVIVGGHRTGWIHTSQRRNSINVGDTVMMEVGAFVRRYVGGVMHTAVIGEPSPTVQRLVKASHQTLDLVAKSVKPGRTSHEVAVEVKRGLDGVSAEAYSTGMYGYAVGLSFPPTWQEGNFMIAEGVDQPLLPGMTFLTPITLRIPGTMGIGFTDTFAVTDTGCEVLTARDRTLTVVPV